jgi:ABC-type sugar transport system ATPase subunit
MISANVALRASADMDHNSVRLERLTKSFGGTKILRGIDLEILPHELLVLLGPSGCGKTTTLNTIAGVEEIESGRIYFGNEEVTNVPPERRDVAMVFQSVGLYPHLNVYDNIVFPLRLRKVPRPVIEERVSVTTELLGIKDLLKRRIHAVSGGERQRVAIAKALVKRPRVFLLDEPFSNLDAEIRRQLRSELVRIQGELKTTMVFVTHDQEEAMSIGNRIVVMNQGAIVQLGTPLDIYKWPANLWAAKFVGNHPINVVPIQIEQGRIVVDGQQRLNLGPAERLAGSDLLPDATGTLGLRPEAISLVEGSKGEDEVPTAVVLIRQVLGSSILYDLELPNRIIVRALAPSTSEHAVGEQVQLLIDWNQARLFSSDTGKLLTSAKLPSDTLDVSRSGAPQHISGSVGGG